MALKARMLQGASGRTANARKSTRILGSATVPVAVTALFLKVPKQLMQVVDFHESFRYFSHVFGRKFGEPPG